MYEISTTRTNKAELKSIHKKKSKEDFYGQN